MRNFIFLIFFALLSLLGLFQILLLIMKKLQSLWEDQISYNQIQHWPIQEEDTTDIITTATATTPIIIIIMEREEITRDIMENIVADALIRDTLKDLADGNKYNSSLPFHIWPKGPQISTKKKGKTKTKQMIWCISYVLYFTCTLICANCNVPQKVWLIKMYNLGRKWIMFWQYYWTMSDNHCLN